MINIRLLIKCYIYFVLKIVEYFWNNFTPVLYLNE